MLIDPSGLLHGERIGACSDEAQLHFPRLMAASNGFGRIEMSYGNIVRTVYAQFTTKPTKKALAEWFREYQQHFLLFPYQSEDGAQWGQWDVPAKMFPRYKKAADHQSPAPPQAEFGAFLAAKAEARKNNYMTPEEDFIHLPISEHVGKSERISEIAPEFQNISEKDDVFPHGIGIGIGIGEKQKQNHVPSAVALDSQNAKQVITNSIGKEAAETIWKLWPNDGGKQQGLQSIRRALVHLSSMGVIDPLAELKARVQTWLAWHAKEVAAGRFVPAIGYAQGWFGDKQKRYLDPTAEPLAETMVLVDGQLLPQSACEADGWVVVKGDS